MNEFSRKRSFGPAPKYQFVEAYQKPNDNFVVIAGPCSVESKEQIDNLAAIVRMRGATHLRGGVFRAGTYCGKEFGWVEKELIEDFHKAANGNGLKNIIEVLEYSEHTLDFLSKNCDAFQVGARAQQHYSLLHELAIREKPVFLKRNTGCTVDEWLGSADRLLKYGCKELYLIERGSSTFHNDVRWAPMIHTIPSVKSICNIPVIIDAAHSTGRRDLVQPITLAGVAAGADGILVEVHEDPPNSLSDPDQAITPLSFEILMLKLNKLRGALK